MKKLSPKKRKKQTLELASRKTCQLINGDCYMFPSGVISHIKGKTYWTPYKPVRKSR